MFEGHGEGVNLKNDKENTFCEYKLKCLKSESNSIRISQRKSRTARVQDNDVSLNLLDRIKSENLLRRMKNVNNTDLHDPNVCMQCQKKEGQISENTFLRIQASRLESELMNEKISKHLLKHNTVTLIGELASNLPRPTEEPQKIWKAFLKES